MGDYHLICMQEAGFVSLWNFGHVPVQRGSSSLNCCCFSAFTFSLWLTSRLQHNDEPRQIWIYSSETRELSPFHFGRLSLFLCACVTGSHPDQIVTKGIKLSLFLVNYRPRQRNVRWTLEFITSDFCHCQTVGFSLGYLTSSHIL